MKNLFSFLLLTSTAFGAEVCRFNEKESWEGKTGLVKCTNFRGFPVREFEIKDGKPFGLEKKFRDGKVIGIAWYEKSTWQPVMEIGFNEYGDVDLITCGKRAFTEADEKYCGFKGPHELKFTNFKGDIDKKATYLNGEIVELITYFSSGKPREEMKVIGEQKRTKVFHEDGTLAAESLEINKKPIWEKQFYTENRLKSESVFKEEGEDMYLVRKRYYKNGVLEEEGKLHAATSWAKEYPVGEFRKFHMNGQLSSQETYDKKGDLEGATTFYDSNGKLVRKQIFSNNKLVKEENL